MKLHVVIDGKTYEVEYDTADEAVFSASSLNRSQSLILPEPGEQDGDTGIDESKVFRNPVAGIVTRIHVEPGQRVEARQILMVVEAMKMENSLAANSPATVASVKVKAGDTVKVGQIAIEFE